MSIQAVMCKAERTYVATNINQEHIPLHIFLCERERAPRGCGQPISGLGGGMGGQISMHNEVFSMAISVLLSACNALGN